MGGNRLRGCAWWCGHAGGQNSEAGSLCRSALIASLCALLCACGSSDSSTALQDDEVGELSASSALKDDGSELQLDADTGDDNTVKLTTISNEGVLEESILWSTWRDVLHIDTEIFKSSN